MESRSEGAHSRGPRAFPRWCLRLLKTHILLRIKQWLQVASPRPGPLPQGPAGLRMVRKNQAEEPSTDTQEAKSLPPPPATHPASFLAEVTEGVCEPLLLSTSFVPLRDGLLPDGVAECWNKHLGCCQLGNGRQFLKWGCSTKRWGRYHHATLSPAFLPCFWHRGRSWASKSKRITWARFQEQMSKLLQKRGKHCTF